MNRNAADADIGKPENRVGQRDVFPADAPVLVPWLRVESDGAWYARSKLDGGASLAQFMERTAKMLD